MQVHLPYGRGDICVELPDREVDVLLPEDAPPLADERAAFLQAVRQPLGTPALRKVAQGAGNVCIVISDWTRPTPNHILVPLLLEELAAAHPRLERITILIAAGTHEPPPGAVPEGWWHLLPSNVKVVIHSAHSGPHLIGVGRTELGEIRLHHDYVTADLRIITGFIEPHFFAGFSGGAKAVVPGIASLDNILSLHGPDLIGDPHNTWLRLEGNPTQQAIVAAVSLCPPHFMLNVTLDREKRITGFFAGQWLEAHRQGTQFCAGQATINVQREYPIVITTNGGYPLDQNLYQTVKGMSAAARITKQGGHILVASACQAGIPQSGNFEKLLREHSSLDSLMHASTQRPAVLDQWEAQALGAILLRHRVHLYSQLPDDLVRECFLLPMADISQRVGLLREAMGEEAAIAVLPLGPLAVPL